MKVKKLLCLGLAAAACLGLPGQMAQAQEAATVKEETAPSSAETQADTDGFEINEDGVLMKYTGEGGDVVVPEGVTSIGEGAFEGCFSLNNITIPNGGTSIGDSIFFRCSLVPFLVIFIPASWESLLSFMGARRNSFMFNSIMGDTR